MEFNSAFKGLNIQWKTWVNLYTEMQPLKKKLTGIILNPYPANVENMVSS